MTKIENVAMLVAVPTLTRKRMGRDDEREAALHRLLLKRGHNIRDIRGPAVFIPNYLTLCYATKEVGVEDILGELARSDMPAREASEADKDAVLSNLIAALEGGLN